MAVMNTIYPWENIATWPSNTVGTTTLAPSTISNTHGKQQITAKLPTKSPLSAFLPLFYGAFGGSLSHSKVEGIGLPDWT